MRDAVPATTSVPERVVRWCARGLSLVILLFWGVFLVAHLVGDAGRPSRPLVFQDYVSLSMLGGSLLGLVVAWKWEVPGGLVALLAVLLGALANWRVLVFPGTLIPVVALLFLASGWLRGTAGRPR